jgi:hypothetical protein
MHLYDERRKDHHYLIEPGHDAEILGDERFLASNASRKPLRITPR